METRPTCAVGERWDVQEHRRVVLERKGKNMIGIGVGGMVIILLIYCCAPTSEVRTDYTKPIALLAENAELELRQAGAPPTPGVKPAAAQQLAQHNPPHPQEMLEGEPAPQPGAQHPRLQPAPQPGQPHPPRPDELAQEGATALPGAQPPRVEPYPAPQPGAQHPRLQPAPQPGQPYPHQPYAQLQEGAAALPGAQPPRVEPLPGRSEQCGQLFMPDGSRILYCGSYPIVHFGPDGRPIDYSRHPQSADQPHSWR